MAKKNIEIHNNALINAIAPIAIDFTQKGFTLGDTSCCGMGVTRYPSSVTYEWLTDISNLNGTIASMTYTPQKDIEAIIKDIGKAVSTNKAIADGEVSSDPVEKIRATKIVEDGNRIIDEIANQNQSVGYLSTSLIAFAPDKENLDKRIDFVKNRFSGRGFNISPLNFIQKEFLNSVSPCDLSISAVYEITKQLLPLSTFLGGFPFSFAGYNDGEGTYWGKDSSGGMIVVDLWKRGGDRNNSSLVVLGASGVGKSTALKHLILNEWEIGTKFVIIDPHGEYKEMCDNLNGDWINVVGGTGGRINPFHIYEKDNDENQAVSKLADHINNLELFFKLYLNLTPIMTAILKECIEITYNIKGVFWDTDISKIKVEDYPIMEDLYNVTIVKAQENEAVLKRNETNYYKELSMLLRSIAIGSDSFIWNGISTVNTTKDFVVFDTAAVNNKSDNIRTTLYHTVLNYCENYLYRNRNERIILVVDEAHNVIDRRLPETVMRLANIQKSCRKFESSLWICSQQLSDFLDELIKKEGEALLNQPSVKLLMPVGKGTDLKGLKALYNLTDAEEERLQQQQRGKGLLFVGSRRLTIDFELPAHRFLDMGSGGGR